MSDQINPLVIIGFGPQGQAWAMNLRDSGRQVFVALRSESPSKELAKALNFNILDLETANFNSFLTYVVLASDLEHSKILLNLKGRAPRGSRFIYAHGLSVVSQNFHQTYPDWDHFLLAPKAIASEVRSEYLKKGRLAAVMDTQIVRHQKSEEALLLIKNLAKDLGITAGPYASSFKEETLADLFSEQSLLCSLIPYGALKSFEYLRNRGVSAEVAYLECWHEVKLIAEAMLKVGPSGFFKLISPNALVGGIKAQEIFFDKAFDDKLKAIGDKVWNGEFINEMKTLGSQGAEEIRKNAIKEWESKEISAIYRNLYNDLYKK